MSELKEVGSDISSIASSVGTLGGRGIARAKRELEDEVNRDEARRKLTNLVEVYGRLARDCVKEFLKGYKEGKSEDFDVKVYKDRVGRNLEYLRNEGGKGREKVGEVFKDLQGKEGLGGVEEIKVEINTDVKGNLEKNLETVREGLEEIRGREEWGVIKGYVTEAEKRGREGLEALGEIGEKIKEGIREEGEGEEDEKGRRKRTRKAKERRRKMRERGTGRR